MPRPRALLVENREAMQTFLLPLILPITCPHTPAVKSLTLPATGLWCLSKYFCDCQVPFSLLPPASGAVALKPQEGVGFCLRFPSKKGPSFW